MNSLLRYTFILLALLQVHEVAAQADPRQVLAGMIAQLQTGRPQAMWYGQELWQTIAMQTRNTGYYPQLAQLGVVQNVVINQQQQLPQGWLFAMTAQHANGQSVWQMGISSISNRIEYATFNIGSAAPPPLPSPGPAPNPTPQPSPTPGPNDSEACRKFPNLC